MADLVVDASGEGSTLPVGLPACRTVWDRKCKKTVVESGRQYVSRWFKYNRQTRPTGTAFPSRLMSGTGFRSAMMLRAEENRWAVVILAPAGEPLPSDDRTLRSLSHGLGDRELRQALARAKPVSPVLRYGPTFNRMMHYDP